MELILTENIGYWFISAPASSKYCLNLILFNLFNSSISSFEESIKYLCVFSNESSSIFDIISCDIFSMFAAVVDRLSVSIVWNSSVYRLFNWTDSLCLGKLYDSSPAAISADILIAVDGLIFKISNFFQ